MSSQAGLDGSGVLTAALGGKNVALLEKPLHSHVTQSVFQVVLQKSTPHKSVNISFTITSKNVALLEKPLHSCRRTFLKLTSHACGASECIKPLQSASGCKKTCRGHQSDNFGAKRAVWRAQIDWDEARTRTAEKSSRDIYIYIYIYTCVYIYIHINMYT